LLECDRDLEGHVLAGKPFVLNGIKGMSQSLDR